MSHLDLQLPVQSVLITAEVVSSNPIRGKMYSIQHYVIKFLSDLRQVGGFLRFPPDHHDINEILLKVELNTIHQHLQNNCWEYFCIRIWTRTPCILKRKEVKSQRNLIKSWLLFEELSGTEDMGPSD